VVRAIKWSLLTLALVALPVEAALSQSDIIFHWFDRQGNLHATDRLQDVPEPYYAMYAARLKALAEKNAQSAPTAHPPSLAGPVAGLTGAETKEQPSIVDAQIAQRKRWKDTMAHWRAELSEATEALMATDKQMDSLQLNPILRLTPQVQDQIAALTNQRQQASSRLENARTMLTETLPQQAQKEHVPPAWLE
jgi:hypothetical protein